MTGQHQHAHIEVTVVGGQQMRGHVEPFAVIRYAGQEHKTKSDKHGGRDPKWNQTLKFEVKGEPHTLEIEVRDNNTQKNELVAYGSVDFSKVITEDRIQGTYPLTGGPNAGHHGNIELDIKYTVSATGYHAAVKE